MPVQTPQDLFVWLLSDVRQREERAKHIFQEMSQAAQDPDIKETLDSWVFLEDKTINTLDHCFKLIGKQPITPSSRLHEVFLEDFRRELNEIQQPLAKALYVASKASQLMHLHIGEYAALTAMADITGHYSVGALIESCLADNLAFVERARRRIRNVIEMAAPMRKAA
ncbi:MAG: ferritin-like domain-containing protein [Chloroflexi bacterium]|nr:ferritin-like domain-containing protein [Chloroflexota bacterium]